MTIMQTSNIHYKVLNYTHYGATSNTKKYATLK